jgi:hypothetical protein
MGAVAPKQTTDRLVETNYIFLEYDTVFTGNFYRHLG